MVHQLRQSNTRPPRTLGFPLKVQAQMATPMDCVEVFANKFHLTTTRRQQADRSAARQRAIQLSRMLAAKKSTDPRRRGQQEIDRPLRTRTTVKAQSIQTVFGERSWFVSRPIHLLGRNIRRAHWRHRLAKLLYFAPKQLQSCGELRSWQQQFWSA